MVKAVTGRGNRREMMIRGCRRTERAVFGGWGTVAAQPPSFLRCGLNEGIETKDVGVLLAGCGNVFRAVVGKFVVVAKQRRYCQAS